MHIQGFCFFTFFFHIAACHPLRSLLFAHVYIFRFVIIAQIIVAILVCIVFIFLISEKHIVRMEVCGLCFDFHFASNFIVATWYSSLCLDKVGSPNVYFMIAAVRVECVPLFYVHYASFTHNARIYPADKDNSLLCYSPLTVHTHAHTGLTWSTVIILRSIKTRRIKWVLRCCCRYSRMKSVFFTVLNCNFWCSHEQPQPREYRDFLHFSSRYLFICLFIYFIRSQVVSSQESRSSDSSQRCFIAL